MLTVSPSFYRPEEQMKERSSFLTGPGGSARHASGGRVERSREGAAGERQDRGHMPLLVCTQNATLKEELV